MNLQNNIDPDQSGSSKPKPENYLPKGSSETNTRSTSKQKQINKPNISRITQEQISNFPRVNTISFDDYIAYSESVLPGSTKDIDLPFLQ